MGYTVIPQSTFQDLQLDAGVLLNTFDPASPGTTPSDSSIICATTGGLQISCVPETEDFGEDVDNCPNNTKELKRITGWDCKISTTALAASAEMIKLSLGAATLTTETQYTLTSDTSLVAGKTYYTRSGTSPNYTYAAVAEPSASSLSSYYEISSVTGKVVPRATLQQSDFENYIWWVGDRSDGGLVAVKLLNALSTGGFSLQTEKKGKGKFTLELTGHVSISAQSVVPMEFYAITA